MIISVGVKDSLVYTVRACTYIPQRLGTETDTYTICKFATVDESNGYSANGRRKL